MVTRATGHAGQTLRVNSLYAGDVGVALLAAEAQQPEQAAMPVFGIEG